MSLAARRSTRLREDFVIRLGCLLVSFAVLASLILEPPRAKAEALTLAAVGGVGLLGAYLAACGMTPYATGMDRNGANEALARTVQEFLDDTFGPGSSEPSGGGSNKPSLDDWLGMITFTVANGVVRFGKEAVDKLNQFAQWVAGKYGTKAGMNQIYVSDGLYTFHREGSYCHSGGSDPLIWDYSLDHPGFVTVSSNKSGSFGFLSHFDIYVEFGPGIYEFRGFLPPLINGSFDSSYMSLDSWVISSWSNFSGSYRVISEDSDTRTKTFEVYDSFGAILSIYLCGYSDQLSLSLPLDTSRSWIKQLDQEESSFGVDVSDTMQQVLDRLTALEEGQSIALDVGATQSMEIQEILQGILDAILAGDLSASAEIVDEAVEPVDPPAGELPDVDGLGLPALGAALTSRFPFSIPWDVYKGVTLLAAPPKAPYFEVDFMAPIADRVGGWQGSTTIVLDFSEYEIIGQVCRWTSTIGFCLMLATGTKRLIWTA